MSLELERRGGRGVHESEQRPHVVVTSVGHDELLHDGERLEAALRVRDHVVGAAGAAALPEHAYNESNTWSAMRRIRTASEVGRVRFRRKWHCNTPNTTNRNDVGR